MPSRYRAVVHRILEDGTEVEIMWCQDEAPDVARSLTDWAKELRRLPRAPVNFPDQMQLPQVA